MDAVFAAAFDYSPTSATSYGLHEYDARLDDLSRPRIEARIRELEALLARVHAVDRASLSFDETIDAEALEQQLLADHYELSVVRSWKRTPCPTPGCRAARWTG